MRRVYRSLLRLYPRDYRLAFAREMLSAFERAGAERQAVSRAASARFTLAELIGLAIGAAREWIVKLNTDVTVRGRLFPDLQKMRPAGVPREVWFRVVDEESYLIPDEVIEAQRRAELLVDEMQQAIACRDFERARKCSDRERQVRQKLRLLRRRYGLLE